MSLHIEIHHKPISLTNHQYKETLPLWLTSHLNGLTLAARWCVVPDRVHSNRGAWRQWRGWWACFFHAHFQTHQHR